MTLKVGGGPELQVKVEGATLVNEWVDPARSSWEDLQGSAELNKLKEIVSDRLSKVAESQGREKGPGAGQGS